MELERSVVGRLAFCCPTLESWPGLQLAARWIRMMLDTGFKLLTRGRRGVPEVERFFREKRFILEACRASSCLGDLWPDSVVVP